MIILKIKLNYFITKTLFLCRKILASKAEYYNQVMSGEKMIGLHSFNK